MISSKVWRGGVIGLALAAGVVGAGALAGAGVKGSGAGAAAAAGSAGTGPFTIDPVHSSVVFRVKHMNAAYFYGVFKKAEGTFLLDAANPSASVISVSVATDSVDTRNEGRDAHLKRSDFFSVAEHPAITFKSKAVEKVGELNGETVFKVTGDFTMLGKTKEITATVRSTGQGPGRGGKEVGGMETMMTINRSDFGMNFMVGQGLGDEVSFTASFEGGR